MKYDLELDLMCSVTNDKYRRRFEDFKSIGLFNIGRKKVLIKILAGECANDASLLTGWPEGVDVVPLQSGNHIIDKLYTYYPNLKADDLTSRWYAKFDDDSVTDVSGLVDSLDMEFDHERDYYITSEATCNDINGTDVRLLEELHYDRWVKNNWIAHEWECCVMSLGAMKRMLQCPDAIKYMHKRGKLLDNNDKGDHSLALAFRMAKVYHSPAYFMTYNPIVRELSLFGGKYNHIHYIANDISATAVEVIKRALGQIKNLQHVLVGREYLFYKEEIHPFAILKFASSGLIQNSTHPNESFWTIRDDKLIFYHDKGGVSWEWTPTNDQWTRITGHHTNNPEDVFQLRMLA